MIDLFPAGFEEIERDGEVELAAYADAGGEEAMESAFGTVRVEGVEPGWETRWREFHHGVSVRSLWVGPPWEQPPTGLEAIVIDPGQAFGTGAHATTRLCLELLAELTPTSLLDAGCGSGVLAIAAAKLGFSPVHALDRDRLAVEATAANAAANDVVVDVVCADALVDPLPPAATTIANLTLEAVGALAPRVSSRVLVTAGYLEDDAVVLFRWRRRLRRALEGWAADVWTPTKAQ